MTLPANFCLQGNELQEGEDPTGSQLGTMEEVQEEVEEDGADFVSHGIICTQQVGSCPSPQLSIPRFQEEYLTMQDNEEIAAILDANGSFGSIIFDFVLEDSWRFAVWELLPQVTTEPHVSLWFPPFAGDKGQNAKAMLHGMGCIWLSDYKYPSIPVHYVYPSLSCWRHFWIIRVIRNRFRPPSPRCSSSMLQSWALAKVPQPQMAFVMPGSLDLLLCLRKTTYLECEWT